MTHIIQIEMQFLNPSTPRVDSLSNEISMKSTYLHSAVDTHSSSLSPGSDSLRYGSSQGGIMMMQCYNNRTITFFLPFSLFLFFCLAYSESNQPAVPPTKLQLVTFDDSRISTHKTTRAHFLVCFVVLCFMCIRGKNNGIKRHKSWARLLGGFFFFLLECFNSGTTQKVIQFFTHKQMFPYRKNTLLLYCFGRGLSREARQQGKKGERAKSGKAFFT